MTTASTTAGTTGVRTAADPSRLGQLASGAGLALLAELADRDEITRLEPVTSVGAAYRFTARCTAEGWRLAGMTTDPVWASFSPVTPV